MSSFAQQKNPVIPTKNDSIQKKNDEFYGNLEDISKKGKVTRALYNLIFNFSKPNSQYSPSRKIEKSLDRNFRPYQGKIIRNIDIHTLDPFGYDEKDTTVVPEKQLYKIGNALHGRTKNFTIRGLILLKENQPLDSILILESERLLRNRNYIRRVFIQPKEISAVSDSVDIQISVLDNWSLAADLESTESWGKLRLRENNIFGIGHRITVTYRQEYRNDKRNAYNFGYSTDNLYNTYINTDIYHNIYFDRTYLTGINIYRPFYSRYTRWAGQIRVERQYYFQSIYDETKKETIEYPLKTITFDNWGGISFPILKEKNIIQRPTNLIMALRFNRVKYLQRIEHEKDPVSFFSDENVFLSSFAFRSVDYIRDQYIFRNGDIEDISVGNTIFLDMGMQDRKGQQYPYLGAGFIFSEYFKFGYLASNIQWGSFFEGNGTRQSVAKWHTTYFTPPFQLGNWYFRQFIKANFVIGSQRENYIKDRINLNGSAGIQGFDSNQVYGTRKFVLSFQTQSYVPFQWLGFRMSPFLTMDFGLIGEAPKPFFHNDLYTKFGGGFLISNDYFIFDNFQFSFFFLPYIPGEGRNIFKMSGTRNDEFGLQRYDYAPPHIIEYR